MSQLLPGDYEPLGFEQITSFPATLTFPAGVNPKIALLQAESANVRWRDDGVAPTSSIGMELISGADPTAFGGNLAVVQFAAASGSPKLNVSYYG